VVGALFRRFTGRKSDEQSQLEAVGQFIAGFLHRLVDADPQLKSRYMAFVLRQQQPYLVALLEATGFASESRLVKALVWNAERPATKKEADACWEVLHKIENSALETLAENAKRTQQTANGAFSYAAAAMTVKFSVLTFPKHWLEVDDSSEILREAATFLHFILNAIEQVSGVKQRWEEVRTALLDQSFWIASQLGPDHSLDS